ncbi:YiiX/YebB-like N1pC/P60 family cysteine hydrolase [Alicyclobacillus fastidiosus]|uniref:Uncharacterized protein n=1 Tax=Alicyclobacillus fastidiosus TaxID=392011 RepID=A0ABV5AJH1_9BACL|nr:YiiX/YebB-like N1pC/P60 family cysteine hydrolase [Alicyclobacillus fastidiosus]WEH08280.1 hypothetical protein PYS47_16455 [Alicyclobacillus fastidiosus]
MRASELQIADLMFIRGNRLLDLPVKMITQSKYTHVAGYCGTGLVIEAQGLRATGLEALSTYKGVVDVYRHPYLTETQKQDIMAFVHEEVGGRYDYLLLGWEAVRHIFGVFLPHLKSKRRICSTLWADAYKSAAGVDLCPQHTYPTPNDLAKSAYLKKVGTY